MKEILENIKAIRSEFKESLRNISDTAAIMDLKVRFLGKKGKVTSLLRLLGSLPAEERPSAGNAVNDLRNTIEKIIQEKALSLRDEEFHRKELAEHIDVTLPSRGRVAGGFHPVVQAKNEVLKIMTGLGFKVVLGPEIEEDYYAFEALNIPPHHPARDMQDTFYFPDGRLLRPHTSPVEIRGMLKYGAPLRIVCPGRVYRKDSDPTHSPMFHQLEGLLVDKDVSIADLKGCLDVLLDSFFNRTLKKRYRASYFPFTEPSLELDIECIACSGSDPSCRICKGSGWLEVCGMGMTHPNVLRYGNIDPNEYNGFAWGLGLDRLAMLKYDLHDLRTLFEGNVPYLLSGRRI